MSAENTHPRAAGQTSSRLGNQARPHIDLYQKVTDQVIGMLELGVAPWRSCILGKQSVGYPRNFTTDNPYRGINVFLLAFTTHNLGYESAYWLTFQQANEHGGKVKRGEKASTVIFWKKHEITDKETGEVKRDAVLRYYNVFNASQCDGLKVPDAPKFIPSEYKPVEAAEKIVQGYKDAPKVEHGGKKAFYLPLRDVVKIPEPTRFENTEEYYGTLFHELIHSTGHSKRLNRKLDEKLAPFGSPDYGREELVAEMGAALLCAIAGIDPVTLPNQAAYLKGWLGTLKGDKRLLIAAAGQAQRAADRVVDAGQMEILPA